MFGFIPFSGSLEEVQNVKVNDDDDGRQTTDAKWWERLTWPFGQGELKTLIKDRFLKMRRCSLTSLSFLQNEFNEYWKYSFPQPTSRHISLDRDLKKNY